MKNFGSQMSFSGDNLDVSVLPPGSEPAASNRILKFSSAAFEMPSYFTLAGSYELIRTSASALQIRGAFQNNNFSGDNFCGAAEWSFKDFAALRGSWFGTLTGTIDPVTGDESSSFGTGDDLYKGYALGGGVNVRSGAAKMGVEVALSESASGACFAACTPRERESASGACSRRVRLGSANRPQGHARGPLGSASLLHDRLRGCPCPRSAATSCLGRSWTRREACA